MDWEFAVLDFLQQMHTSVGDFFFSTITHLGDGGIAWILLTLLLFCFKKTRKYAASMGIAMIFGLLIANVTLKPLIARIRPFNVNTAVNLLVTKPTDFSFPSGHTLSSFAASLSLLHYNKKFGIPAVILASLIAFSRMYLYLHYPTDILAGIIIGFLCSFVACKIIDRLERSGSKTLAFLFYNRKE